MRFLHRIYLSLFIILTAIFCCRAQMSVTTDSLPAAFYKAVPPGTAIVSGDPLPGMKEADRTQGPEPIAIVTKDPDRDWIHLLKKGELDLSDPTVRYPKFVKFCVDVYNWGDRFFNSYDTTYVVGVGRRWKTRVAFDGWMDSYNMNIGRKLPITLISEPYISASVNLQYMAVGISYGVDLNNLTFNKPVKHQKFEFGFNCARFNLDLSFNRNAGGSYVRTLGNYKRGHFFKSYFPGLDMTSLTADIYYYFNNFKYANGAAYYFSKIQKKSAGSFILGFSYAYEDIKFDFNQLPVYLQPFLNIDERQLRFHYNSYCLLFGYGFNWVLGRHFLYNISVMPSMGVI
ncbi:MAG: DUF4421 domain-containing protein, partial [Muribaculaceae bacterium]|nr:DUF4421 domain-containing protein [Muribaculaceae bacterium]